MKLSVIIVNYNVKYLLEQCLLSVFESVKDFEMEVFVVDNNSTDGSQEYIKSRFPQVIYINNPDNPGFAIANNQAIALSKGKYVLLLNPDTVVGEHVLANTCHFMDENPQSGACGVKGINGAGQFLPESKRGFPTPWNSFCKIFGLSSLFPKSPLFGGYSLRYLNENEAHQIDVLVGAFMMIRREAIDKAGNLDETFFMYGEDIDLSYRIVKAGYKNYYLPERIIHYKGESTDKSDMKYVKAFYEAMYIFFKKHYPNYGLIYSFFIRSGILVRSSLATLRRKLGVGGKKQKPQQQENVIFMDHSNLLYEEIIRQMDENTDKNVQYHIYSPHSGMIVGSRYAEKKV